MTRKSRRYMTPHRRYRLHLEGLERRDVPSFAAPEAILAGPSPSDVVGADFNGDGLFDLAVANNSNPGTVNVLLNVGAGVFAPPRSFPTGGSGASALAVADVSGDGRLDMVVTNFNSDSVAVLRGSGTGAFRRPITYAAGDSPTALALADFNGDSIIDLAVANHHAGKASILLGAGGGVFALVASYEIGAKPRALAARDVNSDSQMDLIVVGSYNNANHVVILLGLGNGSLTAGPTYNGDSPGDVAAADFDGDGDIDLAVASNASSDSSLAVWLGNGDGTYQSPISFTVGAGAKVIESADIDGDAILDLVVADTDLDRLEILLGQGNGSFGLAEKYQAGAIPSALAVQDYTGDGNPDIALANQTPGNGTVTLQPGLGGGAFIGLAPTFGPIVKPWEMVAADLNGDGDLDLVASRVNNTNGGGWVNIRLGSTEATFHAPTDYFISGGLRGLTTADFNADGAVDVAVTAWAGQFGGVNVALGNGDGTLGGFMNYPAPSFTRDVAVGDFNGDGHLDLAAADWGGDEVEVLFGIGDGSFQSSVTFEVEAEPASLATGDFNGDGNLDIVTANDEAASLTVLFGNGTGSFRPAAVFPAGTPMNEVVSADFDGDGDLDLAVTNPLTTGTVHVRLNNGNGTFAPATIYQVGSAPRSLATGDINGDGILDLAVGNKSGGTVTLLFGTGTGSFQNIAHYSVGSFAYPEGGNEWPSPIVLTDFDGDGRNDLALALNQGLTVLVNDGIWPPLPIGDGPGIDLGNYGTTPIAVRRSAATNRFDRDSMSKSISAVDVPAKPGENVIRVRPAVRYANVARHDPLGDVLSSELT